MEVTTKELIYAVKSLPNPTIHLGHEWIVPIPATGKLKLDDDASINYSTFKNIHFIKKNNEWTLEIK